MGLPREAAMWFASDGSWAARAFRAFDAPTGWLLLAFLAARSPRPYAERGAYALMTIGFVLALAEFPFHRWMVDNEYLLRAPPLYVGLGVGAFILAKGRPWERWVSLALIARALYWGSAGVVDVARSGLGEEPYLFVNRIGLLALAALAVAAAVRLARQDERPGSGVMIPVLALGPLGVLIETAVRASLPPEDHFRYGSLVLVNLLTLGLVRPILVLQGLAKEALFPALMRVTLAAGVATGATLVASPLDIGSSATNVDAVATYGFGLSIGLLAIAVLDTTPRTAPPPSTATPPSSTLPPPPPAQTDEAEVAGRPQWQVLLLALRGSHLPAGTPALGTQALTQRGLVERTGIRASRISTLVRELNEGAALRLDAHLPGWREGPMGRGSPEVILQFRGAVEGQPGVWVYYRLSLVGEELARTIAETEFREKSPAR